MRELFPDYEFREIGFPEVDDFLNLRPHHAFCRMERAENVAAFHAARPPIPDRSVRATILARQLIPDDPPREADGQPEEYASTPPATPPSSILDDDFTY